ncbi:MAG: sigma 54-interacting transcriptional regulator [Anaerolineales bacterium]|nr:sigma 54-interacting transcriptional regulator [Anaerolineales bacterium]
MDHRDSSNSSASARLVGEAPALRTVLRAARLVAATDATALILGESGTGKELLARLVHAESPRFRGPWVTVNCAALPEDLIESELFGARRGAYTGADRDRSGHVQQAAGGTLFLDEVAELPLQAQAKLLRFLEEGEARPLGAGEGQRVDVRVVAATHRDLRARIAEGRFRADLFYRLHVVPLELPPLRERASDIPLLLDAFAEDLAARHSVARPSFTPALVARLGHCQWPGNVRELRNLVERVVVLFQGRRVDSGDIPAAWLEAATPSTAANEGVRLPAEGLRIDQVEAELITQALERAHGNRSRAARLLGISRHTLLYRMRKYAVAD